MEQTVYWYSCAEHALVNLEPTKEELESISAVKGCIPAIAKAIRADSMNLIPVIPVWVYGTLLEGESAHAKLATIALPEFKPLKGIQTGVQCYVNKEVPFPAAIACPGSSLYMERYLIPVDSLGVLDRYEGAPDLYSLAEMPDIEGFFYRWNKGLESWEPLQTHDWRKR